MPLDAGTFLAASRIRRAASLLKSRIKDQCGRGLILIKRSKMSFLLPCCRGMGCAPAADYLTLPYAAARRYRRLLDTQLSDVERKFIEKRLAEEQAASQALLHEASPLRIDAAGSAEAAA